MAKQVNIPSIKLNNGRDMPALGYGTWLGLDDKKEFKSQDYPKFYQALSYAIDVGYRHIDTAHLYRVEPDIGQVLAEKFAQGLKREDFFITTKVWQDNHRPADVEKSVTASLRRLRLDYLDLVLMHWPMSISEDGVDEKIDYLETWRGFESVLAKGLVKGIGVSNFNLEQMKRLLQNCQVPPACNQIEINLHLGSPDLVSYCQENNVVMVAYAPLGGGAHTSSQDPTLVALTTKYGKTVSQIALRYLYQRNIVSIPKTLTNSRIIENASIFDFNLEPAEMEALRKLDSNQRTVRPSFWQDYEHYPFDKVPTSEKIPASLMKWKNGINNDVE